MNDIFIEGNFRTKKCGKCQYHRFPTCHPMQTDPKNPVYVCVNWKHPQGTFHRYDWEPMVNCKGNPLRCDIPKAMNRWVKYKRKENRCVK